MKAHVEKAEKERSTTSGSVQQEGTDPPLLRFLGNGPEAALQRRLLEATSNSLRMIHVRTLQESSRVVQRMDPAKRGHGKQPAKPSGKAPAGGHAKAPVTAAAKLAAGMRPKFLYHRTSSANANLIAAQGLQPRSGEDEAKYLCMSANRGGVAMLNPRGSDVVFRVAAGELDWKEWRLEGAGSGEFRSNTGIAAGSLEYQLANEEDRNRWSPASDLVPASTSAAAQAGPPPSESAAAQEDPSD